jgi:D-lactate dehydrogenase
MALYGQVMPDGSLRLVNHLGIALGDDAETILARLDKGQFSEADIAPADDRWAHDHSYVSHVRDIESDTPARFNADPRCLFEAAGSAGKLIVFAVRLDTFAQEKDTATFYLGTNTPEVLTELRRAMLRTSPPRPSRANTCMPPPSTLPTAMAATLSSPSRSSAPTVCPRSSRPRRGWMRCWAPDAATG